MNYKKQCTDISDNLTLAQVWLGAIWQQAIASPNAVKIYDAIWRYQTSISWLIRYFM